MNQAKISTPADLLRHSLEAEAEGKAALAQDLRRAACRAKMVSDALGEYPPSTPAQRREDTSLWRAIKPWRLSMWSQVPWLPGDCLRVGK